MSDGLTGLLLLLIAAIPVAVIVALFMAGATRGRPRKLETEVGSLRRQETEVGSLRRQT